MCIVMMRHDYRLGISCKSGIFSHNTSGLNVKPIGHKLEVLPRLMKVYWTDTCPTIIMTRLPIGSLLVTLINQVNSCLDDMSRFIIESLMNSNGTN